MRSSQPVLIGLLCLIVFYVCAGYGLSVWLDATEQFTILLYSKAVVHVTLLLFLFFIGWRVWNLIIFKRPERLTHTLIMDIRNAIFTREKLTHALPIFIGFILFMSAFTSIKALIPLVQDYAWDETFSSWDRMIHGGVDPWRILQPVFGYAWATNLLNVVYNLWFVVMFSVLYWQLFDLRQPVLRLRFFWTFFMTWMINGSVLAMLLSSVGPCFYDRVVEGFNPYAEQMSYLRDGEGQFGWAVKTQDMLWRSYEASQIGLGSGISAMPSVHVAIAVLFALLAWQYGRASKIFFGIFAILIMISSVHLGWHYAIDGYVGAVVTVFIWWGMGKVLHRQGGWCG